MGERNLPEWMRDIERTIDKSAEMPSAPTHKIKQVLDELSRTREALNKHAIHADYDCPGDSPEFCGWYCLICGELDGHKADCLLVGMPVPEGGGNG